MRKRTVSFSNLWRFGLVLLSMLLTLSGPNLAVAGDFSRLLSTEEYSDVQNVSEEIISRFPPEQFFYIGVGRSPSVFLAYLEARLGPAALSQMPMGNLQFFNPQEALYTDENREIISQYIEKFLAQGLAQGKRIVIFDFVFGGASILNLKRELERSPYFDKISLLALKNPHGVQRFLDLFHDHHISFIPLPPLLEEKLIGEAYKEFSKYESFKIVESTSAGKIFQLPAEPVLKSQRYDAVVTEMAHHLRVGLKSCARIYSLNR